MKKAFSGLVCRPIILKQKVPSLSMRDRDVERKFGVLVDRVIVITLC